MLTHLTQLTNALVTRRGLQLLTAAAVLVVALIPLVALPLARGVAWQGSFPYTETDELAYAVYVRALADGRPRRNDPYRGTDERADAPQPESLFSIQFMPAYALAFVARTLNLSVSNVFMLLGAASALAAALVLFWLIAAITGDTRVAATGTLVVLCLGAAVTSRGPLNYVLDYLAGRVRFLYLYPPFMRRYVATASFPLYLTFGALVWRTLNAGRRRAAYVAATGAGVVFALLVYTYFFMWTAAAAWFAAIVAVWLVARPAGWRVDLKQLTPVAALMALSLAPYFRLLARRAPDMDAVQYLWRTHAPALAYAPEALACVVLLLLAWAAWRKHVCLNNRALLFTVACALVPFIVFNQQVLTGYTLQPVHYEMYVANFAALLAAVLACALVGRAWPALGRPRVYTRVLLACALFAVAYGVLGAARTAQHERALFATHDDANSVALRLAALGHNSVGLDTQSVVFAPDMLVADMLPTVAPQSALWAPHMFAFPGADEPERFKQFLYYRGVSYEGIDETETRALDPFRQLFLVMLFGQERRKADLNPGFQPIQPAEYGAAMRAYNEYARNFSRACAARPTLSYLVVAADDQGNLANFDRWYERNGGERIGRFLLYRVRLRP